MLAVVGQILFLGLIAYGIWTIITWRKTREPKEPLEKVGQRGNQLTRGLLSTGCNSHRSQPTRRLRTIMIAVAAVLVSPSAATAQPAPLLCAEREPTLVGTHDADILTGTDEVDVIVGLAGSDTIAGLGGDDVICGGRGGDTLKGGSGNDLVRGSSSPIFQRDVLKGGSGHDQLLGQANGDVIRGGKGDDRLLGGASYFYDDVLHGGAGEDVIRTGPGVDGTDDIPGEVATGGRGDDLVVGSRNLDSLSGGGGDDRIKAREGFIAFTDGTCAGAGQEVEGGPGRDVISAGLAHAGKNCFVSSRILWNQLRGGRGADVIRGGKGKDSIRGGGQNDLLMGGTFASSGRDVIHGGQGSDTMFGFEGKDLLDGGGSPGAPGRDVAHGGSGVDRCIRAEKVWGCER